VAGGEYYVSCFVKIAIEIGYSKKLWKDGIVQDVAIYNRIMFPKEM
jgi:hypothetical protein